jgi:hypothetical protein
VLAHISRTYYGDGLPALLSHYVEILMGRGGVTSCPTLT